MKLPRSDQLAHSPLLTIAEVGDRIRVSTRTIRRLIASGELIAVRIGTQLRVAEVDLEHYVHRQRDM